jgi:AbrB family looped-hinge helix DNA binding protein
MVIIKKIDDIGRISIPKDVRRELRWMGGDEIEVIVQKDNTILLRKHENDTAQVLESLSAEWKDDVTISQQFLDLIEQIKEKQNN